MGEQKPENEQILKQMKNLQREVQYNRIVMAIFFVISLFYINLKTNNIGNVLGTFMEMFMP